MKIECPTLDIIKVNPDAYRLGMVPAELHLPRRQLTNPTGTPVAFNPEQNHREYLRESNLFPIGPALEAQRSIYAYAKLSDMRQVIISSTASPYTVNGDHLIVWAPRGDNFRFQPTLTALSDEQGQKTLEVVANIAAQYDAINGHRNYYVGMNVQPDEFERQSVQSIRDAAHFHVVRMDNRDILELKPLSSQKSLHEFADSYTLISLPLFEQLIASRIQQLPQSGKFLSHSISYKDYPFRYPMGHFFNLVDAWATLSDPGFFKFLQNIQEIISQEYHDLVSCFTNGRREIFRVQVGNGSNSTDFFRRLLPLPSNEISSRLDTYLAQHPEITNITTKQLLIYLAAKIKPASDIVLSNMNGVDAATRLPFVSAHTINSKMIMEGESYNILFFPNPSGTGVMMGFVPRVTSGGSPLDAFGIKKQQYVLRSQEEFSKIMGETDTRHDRIVNQLIVSLPYLSAGSALQGSPLY